MALSDDAAPPSGHPSASSTGRETLEQVETDETSLIKPMGDEDLVHACQRRPATDTELQIVSKVMSGFTKLIDGVRAAFEQSVFPEREASKPSRHALPEAAPSSWLSGAQASPFQESRAPPSRALPLISVFFELLCSLVFSCEALAHSQSICNCSLYEAGKLTKKCYDPGQTDSESGAARRSEHLNCRHWLTTVAPGVP